MSFWGKLGRGLLKIAPIAASFIPGLGPLAGMAIGGASGAADSKLSGGSWMDALRSGGMGAATGYGSGKGVSPSKGFWGRAGDVLRRGSGLDLGGVGGTGNTGFAGGLGRNGRVGIDESGATYRGGGGWQDMLGQILGGSRDRNQSQGRARGQGGYDYGRGNEGSTGGRAVPRQGVSRFGRRMQQQLGPVMGAEDQSNPNLAMSIGAGRMDAIRNQPWRGGYDQLTGYGPEPEDDSQGNVGDPIYSPVPPVYPTGQRRRQVYQ